jgi:hypothetical protein
MIVSNLYQPIVFIAEGNGLLERSKIIANMKCAGWLKTRKKALHIGL